MREKEWCCEGYFAQVYGFEEMALDAGYGSVHKFLQDARNVSTNKLVKSTEELRQRAANVATDRDEDGNSIAGGSNTDVVSAEA